MINMTVTSIYKSGQLIPPNNPPQLLLQTLPGKSVRAPIIDLTITLVINHVLIGGLYRGNDRITNSVWLKNQFLVSNTYCNSIYLLLCKNLLNRTR